MNSTDGDASATQSADPYVPFNAARSALPDGVWPALLVGALGAVVGACGAFARL